MFENGQLTVLNIKDILPNRFQPRIRFDGEKLEELAESIGKYGVIQPIVVRPVSNKFEIIAGERRYKASKLANKSTIPAIIVNLSDKDSEEIALLENIQRQELSPIEEAVSYKRILDMGYITQEELARKLGKAQSTIANKIRLLNLDDEVQSYLLNNKISERHARSLLRIPDKEQQVDMLHRIVEERLTVKQTDKEIEKLKENMKETQNVVKPVVLNVAPQNNNVSVINNTSEEIESLFDETDDMKSVHNERGNNMDIDKIMREAKDINVPQEAPKDISGLMESGKDVQSEPIVRAEEPVIPMNTDNNKFISVVPQPEQPKPIEQPSNGGVTFDSMFNQHVNVDSASNSEMSGVNNSINNVTTSANNGNSNFESPVSVDNNHPKVDKFVSRNLNQMPITSSSVQNDGSVTNEVPSINQENNVEVSDDTKKVISSAVANALKRFNQKKSVASTVSKQTSSDLPSTVSSTPVIGGEPSVVSETPAVASPIPSEPIVQTNQPVNNVASASESNIPSTDIISDNTLNEYAASSVNTSDTMANAMPQNVKTVNNQTHFAQIVKLLRECADKIEQNGYFVNVDELDLGNQYKVTFTIDKE